MESKGIRILDDINGIICVTLPKILSEIHDGNLYYWSILFMDVIGNLGEEVSVPILQKQIYDSKNGLFISWQDLSILAEKFEQVIDIIIIGSNEEKNLRRYEDDQEMYETCDFVIAMVDSGYWEVFSKEPDLIDRLATKFKEIEFLEPDFEK